MAERVLELAQALTGAAGGELTLLESLCQVACGQIDGRLPAGVTAEDCGEAYLVAAVWLAMAGLYESRQANGVTEFSAGDVTVRRPAAGANSADSLRTQAWELLTPWIGTVDFVFRGVPG